MSKDKTEVLQQHALRAATIAERLSLLRRERNLSQDAVGSIVGASQATVSRWEDSSSLSSPSAIELAELASYFEVDPGWILGRKEHRASLPEGGAIIDQALLTAFSEAKNPEDLRKLLEAQMNFGTIWVEIPQGAEIVTMQEALRRVKETDRHVRKIHPGLWQDWAELILR